jgi:hypothetical protein
VWEYCAKYELYRRSGLEVLMGRERGDSGSPAPQLQPPPPLVGQLHWLRTQGECRLGIALIQSLLAPLFLRQLQLHFIFGENDLGSRQGRSRLG